MFIHFLPSVIGWGLGNTSRTLKVPITLSQILQLENVRTQLKLQIQYSFHCTYRNEQLPNTRKTPCRWNEPTLPNDMGSPYPKKAQDIFLSIFINRREKMGLSKSLCLLTGIGQMPFQASFLCEMSLWFSHRCLRQEFQSLKLSSQMTASTCDYRLQSLPSQRGWKMTHWQLSQLSLRMSLFITPPAPSTNPHHPKATSSMGTHKLAK